MNKIPTIKELYAIIVSNLESEFNTTIPSIGKSFLRVFAIVLAGQFRLYYLYLAKVQKNTLPDIADPSSMGGTLERWGLLKLGRLPDKAVAGKYLINIIGTGGSELKATQTWISDDTNPNSGYLFVLDSDYTLTGSGDQITVRALTSGLESELFVGNTISLNNPVSGVETQGTVASVSLEPLSAESTEAYREDIINSFRILSQGGSQGDYFLWATGVQAVANAFPYAKSGASNEVNLYIEATIPESVDNKGSASAQLLLDVQSAIEDPIDVNTPARKPVSTIVNYISVTPLDIDIVIIDAVDMTAEKLTLITNALENYFSEIRPYLAGITPLADKKDTVTLNDISSVILEAVPNLVFLFPSMDVDGSNEAIYTFENGDIPYLNSVSYT